jgi:hypothetical protein
VEKHVGNYFAFSPAFRPENERIFDTFPIMTRMRPEPAA